MYFFWGKQDWASQWHPSEFTLNNVKYFSCEQYMMAQKAKLFEDGKVFQMILKCKDPRQQKALGRKVKGFKNSVWNKHKERIVYEGNLAKFSQNEHLKTKLLETKNQRIVEASPHDKIWGIGMKASHPDALNPDKWKGLNLLGQAIMKVRKELSVPNQDFDFNFNTL